MTSLPFVVDEEARGIIIKAADASRSRPARFWAYMWTDEDDGGDAQPWHRKVPVERAA